MNVLEIARSPPHLPLWGFAYPLCMIVPEGPGGAAFSQIPLASGEERMGRLAYQTGMEQRLRDLSLQIDSVRTRLMDGADDRLNGQLAGQLRRLEFRRDTVREKLDALSDEPDCTWEELKAEIEDEWDTLVQDFEERVSGLA